MDLDDKEREIENLKEQNRYLKESNKSIILVDAIIFLTCTLMIAAMGVYIK